MYSIVDIDTAAVVPQRGQTSLTFRSLARVVFPDGSTADSTQPGQEIPPQYGEPDEPPVRFRLYEVALSPVDIPDGMAVVAINAPFYNAADDTVTVTRILKDTTPSPLESWQIEMAATDAQMPRWFEDYITDNNIALAPGRTKDNYDAKKALRAEKP